jgi:exosortase A-associated hydrolase 2
VRITQDAFFLSGARGERFCVWRAPLPERPIGIVVHVPAFAEEMNKSRHVTAAAARALAERGFGVLTVDLIGCGDSPGDFADAEWDAWVDDVVASMNWARTRGSGPIWLWALRAGALLASAALRRLDEPASLLLWQPVLSGRVHLTQFLRLGITGGVVGDGVERSGTKQLLARLGAGQPIEIAGYTLSPSLCHGLATAEFDLESNLPPNRVERIVWLEVDASARTSLSAAGEAMVDTLRGRGVQLDTKLVAGPGFWQAVELADCPALIEASTSMLTRTA